MAHSHTPGPWKFDVGNMQIESEADETYRYPICDLCSETDLNLDPEESVNYRANADLIAAAPELLEACEEILAKALKEIATSSAWLKYDWPKLERIINKARGET